MTERRVVKMPEHGAVHRVDVSDFPDLRFRTLHARGIGTRRDKKLMADKDVPFAVDYYTTEERAQDIEAAKALLEEAGYGDGLTISALGAQDTEGLYTVIQAQLALAGITLEINTVDIPTFVQGANGGDYDVIIVGEYLDSRNPSAWVFFDENSINTFCIGGPKWTSDEIQSTISDVITAADNDTAKEKVAALEELFKKDTLVLNLCPEMKAVITQTDIKGLTTRERGFIDVTNFYREAE